MHSNFDAMRINFLSISLAYIFLVVTVSQKACKINEPPSFINIDKISITDLTQQSIGITSNANFHNSNDVGITIDKVELNVIVNGKQIGSIAQQKSTKIKSRADFSIPIKLQISQGNLYNALGGFTGTLGAVFGKDVEIAYQGKVTICKFWIPYTIPINYTSKYRL